MAQDYYVDASRPDDSGDGKSPETAKKTPWDAQAAAASGDRIWLKRGYCYAPGGGVGLSQFFRFQYQSNIEIGSYGSASEKPILDGLTYQNPGVTGWTHVADGIWKKSFGNYWVRRLWVGSRNNGVLVSDRVMGTGARRATGTGMKGRGNPAEATILAALSSTDIWYGGGSTTSYALYVYTGSSLIDPSTYYEGLSFVIADNATIGSTVGIHVQNQTGIYAHDIHLRGCGRYGIELLAKNSNVRDVQDCLFEDMDITHIAEGAATTTISAEASPVRRIRSCTFRRIYADSNSSAHEEEPGLAYENLTGAMDAFAIAAGSVGVAVQNCTVVDAMHTGISVQSRIMDSAPPQGCQILNNTIRFRDRNTYGRGLDGLDGDTLFQGNKVEGQCTRSQFAGSVQVVGNIWMGMRTSVRRPGTDECAIFESYIFDSEIDTIGDARYIPVVPVNVLFANNTIYGSKAASTLKLNFYNSTKGAKTATYSAGTVSIVNNICHSRSGKFLSTYEDSGKTIGQQTITNNRVYNGHTNDEKINWRGTPYNINAAPGCADNAETDPELDVNHRPHAADCIGAGVYLGGKDYYGKHFYNPPNIGAVEDVTNTPRYALRYR